jgi:hypothetical protein
MRDVVAELDQQIASCGYGAKLLHGYFRRPSSARGSRGTRRCS